jgi:hypothetical protein
MVPKGHVEGRMLSAHETDAARAVGLPECQRQQQQRTAVRVEGDHDEGSKTFTRADLMLPWFEEIEALIRSERCLRAFQAAPEGLRGREVVNDIDALDAARARPRICIRCPVFNRGSHGHRRARVI